MRRLLIVAAVVTMVVGAAVPVSAATERYPGYSSELTARWADYDEIVTLRVLEIDGMGEYYLDIDLSVCQYEPPVGDSQCWDETGNYVVTDVTMTKRGGTIDVQVEVEQRYAGSTPPTQWVTITGEWKMTQPDVRRQRSTTRDPDGWWRSTSTTYTDESPDFALEFDVLPIDMPMPPLEAVRAHHYDWIDSRGGG